MKKSKERQRRSPTFIEGMSGLLSLIILIIVGNLMLGLRVELMFVLATFYVCFIGVRCGLTYSDLKKGMIDSVASNAEILCIMLGIGFIISSWIFSGTIPVMIAWLAKMISVRYVLVLSFVFCGIIAAIIGTSSATMGTIGVIMLSVATIQGVSPGIAAAAVVSGSFIGQSTSVLADMVNWNAGLTDNTPQSLVKLTLPAELTGIVVSVLFFFFAGTRIDRAVSPTSFTELNELIENVYMNFNASVLVLLPVIVLFICILAKVDTLPTMFISGIVALLVGIFLQGFSLSDGFLSVYSGFDASMLNTPEGVELTPKFINLVSRGGMLSMSDFLVSIPLMMAYCGALSSTGSANVVSTSLFKKVRRPGNAIACNTVSALFLCASTGSVMAPGMLASEMFSDIFEENGLSRRNLGVPYLLCCAMGALLFPWTAVCAYAASIVKVSATQFIPYLTLVYVPIITYIIFGYLGIGIEKIDIKSDKSCGVDRTAV